jgi:hypothetical protein
VRHGHEREIVTGIGPVAVRCPRVRDRVGKGSERIRFSSAILPPYARRSKSLEVLIPILYCESACKKDPLFGVIGVQSGPPNRGSTLASMILGSRGWDAGRGDDCKDPSRVF